MEGFFGPVEQYDFLLGGLKNIPSSHLWILLWDGEDPGSIWRTSLRHLKTTAFIFLRT
jgi:hypothetical protein